MIHDDVKVLCQLGNQKSNQTQWVDLQFWLDLCRHLNTMTCILDETVRKVFYHLVLLLLQHGSYYCWQLYQILMVHFQHSLHEIQTKAIPTDYFVKYDSRIYI
jgi:hypothetical protein